MLPEMLECSQFVNSDEFAKGLNPFSPGSASVSASRYMLLKINYLINKNEDFAIETTLATRSLKKIIDKAHEAGYSVTILYFWLNSPELAIERIRARVAAGGHDIPDATVVRRYHLGLEYFFNIYKDISDRWILADNSTIPFKIVAQGWKNNMVVQDNKKFIMIKELSEKKQIEDSKEHD